MLFEYEFYCRMFFESMPWPVQTCQATELCPKWLMHFPAEFPGQPVNYGLHIEPTEASKMDPTSHFSSPAKFAMGAWPESKMFQGIFAAGLQKKRNPDSPDIPW